MVVSIQGILNNTNTHYLLHKLYNYHSLFEVVSPQTQDFFHHDSVGVKEHILTSDIKQLKIFTKLYKQTTEALISEFMKDFASKGTCMYVYVYMYVCMYMYIYIHMYIQTYIHTYIHTMYVLMYICMYMYVCMYVCMYICMYVCTCVCTMYLCAYKLLEFVQSSVCHQPYLFLQ